MLLVAGFGASAQAQTVTVVSENAYQLADVCRIEVVFRLEPTPDIARPFLFALRLNDTQLIQVRLYSLGVTSYGTVDNEYSNLHCVIFSPAFAELTPTTPFTVTLWLNLPADFTETIQYFRMTWRQDGQAREARTAQSYSIAKDCPKGN